MLNLDNKIIWYIDGIEWTKNILTVGPVNRDFINISDAIDSITDDTLILIEPGIYSDSNLTPNKYSGIKYYLKGIGDTPNDVVINAPVLLLNPENSIDWIFENLVLNVTDNPVISYDSPLVEISTNIKVMVSETETPVTLSWTSRNANLCSIDPGIGEVELSGSMDVLIEDTTHFTITASKDNGDFATDTIVVSKFESTYVDNIIVNSENSIDSGKKYIPPPTISSISEWLSDVNMPYPVTITHESKSTNLNIYYTLDTTDPTVSSIKYTSIFNLINNNFQLIEGWPKIVIKAVAEVNGEYSTIVLRTTNKIAAGIVSTNPPIVIVIEQMLINPSEISSGRFYEAFLSLSSNPTDSLAVVPPVIDGGRLWNAILTTENLEDNMTISSPVIDGGRFWNAIVEG